MLDVGARIPLAARVWLAPREEHTLAEVVAPGPVLLVFYPFDWSAT